MPGAEYAGLTIRNDGTLVNGQNRAPPSLAFEQLPEGSSNQRRNSPTQGGQVGTAKIFHKHGDFSFISR